MDVDLQDAAPGHRDEAQGQIAQGSRALPAVSFPVPFFLLFPSLQVP